MKSNVIKRFLIAFSIVLCLPLVSQTHTSKSPKKHPDSFQISKQDFDALLTKKPGEDVDNKNNVYIDKSNVLMNVLNGDMQFVKIKLNYFAKAILTIQVNGVYSTQVFVLSDDKSVFYKGKIDNGKVTMTQCKEDDIVSE